MPGSAGDIMTSSCSLGVYTPVITQGHNRPAHQLRFLIISLRDRCWRLPTKEYLFRLSGRVQEEGWSLIIDVCSQKLSHLETSKPPNGWPCEITKSPYYFQKAVTCNQEGPNWKEVAEQGLETGRTQKNKVLMVRINDLFTRTLEMEQQVFLC